MTTNLDECFEVVLQLVEECGQVSELVVVRIILLHNHTRAVAGGTVPMSYNAVRYNEAVLCLFLDHCEPKCGREEGNGKDRRH